MTFDLSAVGRYYNWTHRSTDKREWTTRKSTDIFQDKLKWSRTNCWLVEEHIADLASKGRFLQLNALILRILLLCELWICVNADIRIWIIHKSFLILWGFLLMDYIKRWMHIDGTDNGRRYNSFPVEYCKATKETR